MVAGVHVPEELVQDILSRVPVKSILRFKTCSKKWYSLLTQNHQFANFHLKKSKDNNLSHHANFPVIFQTSTGGTQFESLNIDTNASRKFNLPVELDTGCQLIGSANGLVCVAPCRKGGCYIWNPCTGECIKISVRISCSSSVVFGFGYDSCSDDYKIVGGWGEHFRVFSLRTNSWKIFEYSFYKRQNGFHFNGAIHWRVNEELVSFDLAKEVFSFIELPDELKVTNFSYCFYPTPLWQYQGLLYLSGLKWSTSIWMMKEFSNRKSWVKSNTFLAKYSILPLGISTLGEVVYRAKGGSGIVKSDIHGIMSDDDKSRIKDPYAFVYTESLISPICIGGDALQPRSKKMIKRPRKQRKTSAT